MIYTDEQKQAMQELLDLCRAKMEAGAAAVSKVSPDTAISQFTKVAEFAGSVHSIFMETFNKPDERIARYKVLLEQIDFVV